MAAPGRLGAGRVHVGARGDRVVSVRGGPVPVVGIRGCSWPSARAGSNRERQRGIVALAWCCGPSAACVPL